MKERGHRGAEAHKQEVALHPMVVLVRSTGVVLAILKRDHRTELRLR